MHRLPALLLLLVIGGYTSGVTKPEAGVTWQLEAEDLSGTFGSITVERGAIIPLPPGTDAEIFFPGASVARSRADISAIGALARGLRCLAARYTGARCAWTPVRAPQWLVNRRVSGR